MQVKNGKWIAAAIVMLSALLLTSGCGRSKKPVPAQAAHRVWSEVVSSHTAGLVSRNSAITVRFSRPVVEAAQVGKSAAGILQTEPKIDGTLSFTSVQELVLTPSQPLKRGQGYLAKLDPKKLKDLPANLTSYEFNFSVIAPEFALKSAALETAPADDALQLRGVLETADTEDAPLVEKLLGAQLSSQPLTLRWVHSNGNRTHEFSATGIERQAQSTNLRLSWDGSALGLDDKGTRDLEVPARGVFKVLDTSIVSDGRQSVRVHFSERLDPNQNLAALVTLDKLKITTRIDGNALSVYPDTTVNGDYVLRIGEAVRNARGTRLDAAYETTVTFANERPQVRFAGKGVILPDNDTLTIPIEAMNVQSVQVTAMQVYENNIGQFLQSNNLSDSNELHRVGRHLWRKTIVLPSPQANRWTRYALDASELLRKYPRALFHLSVSINRGNSLYSCSKEDAAVPVVTEEPARNNEDLYESGNAGWSGSDEYYEGEEGYYEGDVHWRDRDDPCKDAYYRWADGIRDERNFLASDIGLLAKRGIGGALKVVATSLRDARPLSGVDISVFNFQNQPLAKASTNGDGFADIDLGATPFYLIARKGEQAGYLKLNRGAALPVSHFDTGGETLAAGLKGFIYGERGVWRPGDDIFLHFMLMDRSKRLPAAHPATLQLFNPRGQLVLTQTNTQPVDGLYAFKLKTADDAPTGTWNAKVLIGGAEFTRALKIETAMPNRLKLALKFPGERLQQSAMPLQSKVWAQWLHGATATGLKVDVAAKLDRAVTRFARFGDYVFDDPARSVSGERETVFEGRLDEDGNAAFNLNLQPASEPAGMMQAQFTTRVFENGGAFSTGHDSLPYSPYDEYVGLRLPKTDLYGSLPAGKPITVALAAVDAAGNGVDADEVELSVYRIDWRWWWENNEGRISEYAQAVTRTPVSTQALAIKGGRSSASFTIQSEQWGRYLVRACLKSSGHCTGQTSYIGWTGGEDGEKNGPGASALRFSSDKPKYSAGETAAIQLPANAQGRALLTIENGSSVLERRWLQLDGKGGKLELPIKAEMAPNVYVALTLLQPHAGKDNDRPIRLYGIIPIEVLDPQTQLVPTIKSADLWRPNGKVQVEVSEKSGREMTYTLAVVDEGLLGLTSFKTPNPHEAFYRREALGVQTWDLFDDVAGAYGGELERLLALGGDQGGPSNERNEQKRFPPVVRVLGPFTLPAGKTHTQTIDLPEYIGEVRLMVVAGHDGAYGAAEKSVVVREPLSLLATLPRVLGPGETLQVPVSVFAFENDVREVKLAIETDAGVEVQGATTRTLSFDRPGERLAFFGLKVQPRTGKAQVTVRASSGPHASKTSIALDVRASNPLVTRQLRAVLAPGETWREQVKPFGVLNTNTVSLEVSRVPPLDLERRLGWLIQYPHGCVEQTTSAVFPQLYLDRLVELKEARKQEAERNIKDAISRLRGFQISGGGFAYWPGNADVNVWGTNYAGHFLAEAKRLGYHVPPEMFDAWLEFQRNAATNWSPGGTDLIENQAYRLLTLALADRPEVGAMNRLRESTKLEGAARLQLAAAYGQIGLKDAASDVMRSYKGISPYAQPGPTFASETRDRGILLNALLATSDLKQAELVAADISKDLSSDNWYSTQSTAYALLAMARFAGGTRAGETFSYRYRAGTEPPLAITSKHALSQFALPKLVAGGPIEVVNQSKQNLFVHVLVRGSPPPGEESAAAGEGLTMSAVYHRLDGSAIDVSKLAQGTDFVATVTVTNRSGVSLDDLALTQIVASGWEIHNPRFEAGDKGEGDKPAGFDYQDIRDDRVLTYFRLNHGESRSFKVLLNASYLGHYYLPALSVESMYDARKFARTAGQWTDVISR